MKARLVVILCGLVLCGESYALTSFYAGNSLIWSVSPNDITTWAASRGKQHVWGQHIANGYNLKLFAQYPWWADYSAQPYGPFSNAMPNYDWDVITIEPFGVWDPWTSDAIMIPQIVDQMLVNPDHHSSQVYLFQSHPFLYFMNGLNYTEMWDQEWNGSGYSTTVQTRDYWHTLMDQVQSTEMGLDKEILMVPAGEVMYELDKRMRAGMIPGFDSVLKLYANDGGVHLRADSGYFLVATVFYATIFQDDPRGLSVPAWMRSMVTPEYAAVVQRVAWDVITGHPYTGVPEEIAGDFNSDGEVDEADFAVWKSTFGSKLDLRADANVDLVVDSADYTIWRNAFEAALNEPPVVESVPEPSCCLLGGICVVFGMLAHRPRV